MAAGDVTLKLPGAATKAFITKNPGNQVYVEQGELPSQATSLTVTAGAVTPNVAPGERALIIFTDAGNVPLSSVSVVGDKQFPASALQYVNIGKMSWKATSAAEQKRPYLPVLNADGTFTSDPDPAGTIALADVNAYRAQMDMTLSSKP